MPSALTGITAISLSSEHAAAAAGMLLADNGADVVVIEPPASRGQRRRIGEPVWDRGKESVALDITMPRGADALRKMLATADVLIEGFPPGEMEARGLGYETLHHEFPHLVYCSISGYGAHAPEADRPASPALVEARTGALVEQAGDRPGPHFLGFPTASYGAMFLAINGILAALYARLRTGQGQHVDTSLRDGMLGLSAMRWFYSDESGDPRPRPSSRTPIIVNRSAGGLWECANGEYMMVHTMARGAFNRLMRLVGLPQFSRDYDDPQEPAQKLPVEDAAYLNEHLAGIFRSRPRVEWLGLLNEAEIPVQPAQPAGLCFDDEQVNAMNMIMTVDDTELGPTEQVSPGASFERTPASVRHGAPRWGADTAGALEKAGIPEGELAALLRDGIIATASNS